MSDEESSESVTVPVSGHFLVINGTVFEIEVEDVTDTIKYVNRSDGWGEWSTT